MIGGWRVGRTYGLHVYEVSPTSPDGDRAVAAFHREEDAARAVAAVNAALAGSGDTEALLQQVRLATFQDAENDVWRLGGDSPAYRHLRSVVVAAERRLAVLRGDRATTPTHGGGDLTEPCPDDDIVIARLRRDLVRYRSSVADLERVIRNATASRATTPTREDGDR